MTFVEHMFDKVIERLVVVVAEMTEWDRAVDPGGWLIAHRWEMDRGESAWLTALAEFDRDQGWAADGQLSCAEWLIFRTKMARATAFEKLRISHQLRARPVVAAAFADGRLSYSAVRAITRAEDPDPDTDAALVDLAVAGTVADVERAVRCYQLHADQHRAPSDAWARRGVRIVRGFDGTGRVEIILADVEIEELAAALQAFVDLGDRSSVDESSAEDSEADLHGGTGTSPSPGRRADAFMDLVRVALVHADDGHAAGDDRYLVHVITGPCGTELAGGTPLAPEDVGMIACDAAVVAHVLDGDGEPLALGRKTRVWSTAQRRAALVRDGGTCRFPGCARRIADLHHQRPWASGGQTDLDNGFLVCPRHHTLLHRGYQATGNPNRILSFHRPDGTALGTTAPAQSMTSPARAPSRSGLGT